MTVTAVIVAGGEGDRFGAPGGKQLADTAGRPMLAWTVAAFESCSDIDSIVVVAHPDHLAAYARAAKGRKVLAVVAGGDSRQDSVAAGLAAIPVDADLVAVHDGARPLVTAETISHAIRVLAAHTELAGVVVGHPIYDTVKRVGGRSVQDLGPDVVAATLHRAQLWQAQTPQVFRTAALRDAYSQPRGKRRGATDDSSLVERTGGRIMMVRGFRENIKVTVPEDLVMVEAVLEARRREKT